MSDVNEIKNSEVNTSSGKKNIPEYILEVKGLKKYFPIETTLFGTPTRFLKAVDDISFKVKAGTTIGVVGESGCGKTTLGRTILKLHESSGGQIIFNGTDITEDDCVSQWRKKYLTKVCVFLRDRVRQ